MRYVDIAFVSLRDKRWCIQHMYQLLTADSLVGEDLVSQSYLCCEICAEISHLHRSAVETCIDCASRQNHVKSLEDIESPLSPLFKILKNENISSPRNLGMTFHDLHSVATALRKWAAADKTAVLSDVPDRLPHTRFIQHISLPFFWHQATEKITKVLLTPSSFLSSTLNYCQTP